jgi:hypothetical protein
MSHSKQMRHVAHLGLGLAAVLLAAQQARAETGTLDAAYAPLELTVPVSAAPETLVADEIVYGDASLLLLEGEALAEQRAGQAVGNQVLAAVTQGNVINGDYTAGNVSLADNALFGFNGIGSVVINTGAQVSLQSGINLVINVNP